MGLNVFEALAPTPQVRRDTTGLRGIGRSVRIQLQFGLRNGLPALLRPKEVRLFGGRLALASCSLGLL
jgi:hypothetical protein